METLLAKVSVFQVHDILSQLPYRVYVRAQSYVWACILIPEKYKIKS
jgi:hypothetical protein